MRHSATEHNHDHVIERADDWNELRDEVIELVVVAFNVPLGGLPHSEADASPETP